MLLLLYLRSDHLEPVIWPGTLELADHTNDAMRDLKSQHKVTVLALFLEFCNVYRTFVPNFSCIDAPLSKSSKTSNQRLLPTHTTEARTMSITTGQTAVSITKCLTTQRRILDPWQRCGRWATRICLYAKATGQNEKGAQLLVKDA